MRTTPAQADELWRKAQRLVPPDRPSHTVAVNRVKLQQFVEVLNSGPLTRGICLPDGTNLVRFLVSALKAEQ